jgi:hypothetical protein
MPGDSLTITADVTLTALWDNETAVDTEATEPRPDNSTGSTTETDDGSGEGAVVTGINDGVVPLVGSPGMHWALANLIFAILALASALIALFVFLRRRSEARDNGEISSAMRPVSFVWLIIALIAAVLGLALFLLTENMSFAMALLDSWTAANVLLFVCVLVATLIVAFRRGSREAELEF